MPTVSVSMVERLIDSTIAQDGGHAVMWFQPKGGDAALPLAIPCDQLPALIDRCAQAYSQGLKVAGSDPLFDGNKTAVAWWTSAVDPQSKELTLNLTFGSGGTLNFAFSEPMARALLSTLQGHYGRTSAIAATLVGNDRIGDRSEVA